MKLKQPVTVTITESESLAFLWHIFNHSGLIAKGAYNLNGISKKDLIELGNQAHRNNNSTEMFKSVDNAAREQKIDVNTGGNKVEPITVKLNDEYKAIVTPSGVTVGCQQFSHETVRDLYDAVSKMAEKA